MLVHEDKHNSKQKNVRKDGDKSKRRNGRKSKHNFALGILVFVMLFIIQFATVLFAILILYLLVLTKVITMEWVGGLNPGRVILLLAIVNPFVGIVVVFTATAIPLKPVSNLINQINRLASGDFQARLQFGRLLASYPTFVELTDSFNKMAEHLGNTEVLRNDFINNFSHEFKTPIVSILGFARLLRSQVPDGCQSREYLDIIIEESRRLSDLSATVLNLSKVESLTLLTDKTVYSLSEQIRESILLLESKWSKKQINFDIDMEEVMITANEPLLKQVWMNLLDNAVKFSPAEGRITITLRLNIGNAVFTVKDQGEGIDDKTIKFIFDKFYQGDTSHNIEGNGLGLPLVKKILELHRGEVSVQSQAKKGCIFIVRLPV